MEPQRHELSGLPGTSIIWVDDHVQEPFTLLASDDYNGIIWGRVYFCDDPFFDLPGQTLIDGHQLGCYNPIDHRVRFSFAGESTQYRLPCTM